MNATPFRASGLTKSFGRNAVLAGLDLELHAGKVTVLLGANGTGKSTLMRLALGVLKAERGTLEVVGHNPLTKPRRVRQNTGFVPDTPDAYGWMTARDLLRFLAPQYPTWDAQHAEELIEQLDVPPRTALKNMSRGQGMKMMLVAALARRPPLLLLDEPFAGLDPLVREEVLSGVLDALREGERTVLCATHDLEVASRIADRVAVMSGGQIRRHGTLEEVLQTTEPAGAPTLLRELLAAVQEQTAHDESAQEQTAQQAPAKEETLQC